LTSNYVSADDAIQGVRREVNIQARDLDTLFWLSQQAQWLLEHPQQCLNRKCLREAYLYRLYESGFASVSGTVHMNQLSLDLSKKYQHTGLSKHLNIQFTQDHITQWIRRVIGGNASTTEHLMALHFLEVPVFSMIESLAAPVWFEHGPWPCLNPLCRKFGKDVIGSHELTIISRRMIGTFTCDCGYAYQRIGPDTKGEHRHSPYRSVPNETFDSVIRRMCALQELSLTDIKDKLFTSYSEVKRALIRLGIDSEVRKEEFESHGSSACPPNINRLSKFEKQRERKREEVQTWMERHPNATRSDIRNGPAAAIRWLQQHDPEWLMTRMPPQLIARVDPNELLTENTRSKLSRKDKALAAMVPAAARELGKRLGRPQRITSSRILMRLGLPNGLANSGKSMKLTRAALGKHSETLPQCAVRRIRWCVDESKQTGKHWGLAALLFASGIRKEWIDQYSSVAQAVTYAQRELGI
jgi:hypothetical protein